MSTATIFGSFPLPAAQPTAMPALATAVAPIFEADAKDAGNATTAFGAWLGRVQRSFGRWAASNAQSRADTRVWEVARSDPRVMADLMHARSCDDSEWLAEPAKAALLLPVAPVLEDMPAGCQPHQRTAGNGWGRVIEDAYQHRSNRHATSRVTSLSEQRCGERHSPQNR